MPAAGALLCFSEAGGGGFLLGAKMGDASTAAMSRRLLRPAASAAFPQTVGKVSGVLIGVLVFEVLKI